jgi:hypothetical protein
MVFIVSLDCVKIKAEVLQVRSCHADPGLDRIIAKRICDRSVAFWGERSRPGVAFGEREPFSSAIPGGANHEGRARDAQMSRNLRDGSAVQIGRIEIVEDTVDVGVSIDVILAFHDSPEGRDHREDEMLNCQYDKPRI